jgi:hypothetical protein
MHHCLTTQELRQLIDYITRHSTIDDGQLLAQIEQAMNWQLELSALAYLFSHILCGKTTDSWDCPSFIRVFYRLEEQMYFHIQECDFEFIDYMLMNLRRQSLSLEEELVDFQNRLGEHRYEHNLRY